MTRFITRATLAVALAAPLSGCGADGEPVTPTTRSYGGVDVTVSGDVSVGVVNGQIAYGSLGRSVRQSPGRTGW